jgi:hypothetical protein
VDWVAEHRDAKDLVFMGAKAQELWDETLGE